MVTFERNSNEKKHHPKKYRHIDANVAFAMPSILLGDSKPNFTEAKKFLLMIQELNGCLFDWTFTTVENVHETMKFL